VDNVSRNPTSRRKPRADGVATRQALIDAAVSLLLTESDANITTTRLAQQAGVVQSGFYAHFANRDACLTEAALVIGDELRALTHAWRREGLSEEQPGRADESITRRHFARVLPLIKSRGRFLELLSSRRNVHSILGERLHGVHRAAVHDVAEDFISLAQLHRVEVDGALRVEMTALAEVIVDSVLTAAAALRRGEPMDLWIDTLTNVAHASVTAAFLRRLSSSS
jgi:AcrR family transcriptional regulator